MHSEIARRADFSQIRYGQCWEDTDVLLEGLDIQRKHVCLSIASAGDNTLAMLSRGPQRVIAVDLSPAQLACLELRVAAYRELSHQELLELFGSVPSQRRTNLYRRCRPALTVQVRRFWDARMGEIEKGLGGTGKFERYLNLFRTRVLPLAHSARRVTRLLQGGTRKERELFYEDQWNTRRWRFLFRVFFSRLVMGRIGRDPNFFRYAESKVSERILERTRHALTILNPAENPYLQWILTGHHPTALPYALRPENFDPIRAHLDRLEWRRCSVEDFLTTSEAKAVDRYNFSDVFEYVSTANYEHTLEQVAAGRSGARLAYWNLLADRHRPLYMAGRVRPLRGLARRLHGKDKAFFYSAFVVEEIR